MDAIQDPSRALAQRLRELRLKGLEGGLEGGLTQTQLARALGVSSPLISSWEKDTPPPLERLNAYARLFATPRSGANGRIRLLAEEGLDAEERARRTQLEQDLVALRAAMLGDVGTDNRSASSTLTPSQIGPWYFPDGFDVTIVCARLPPELRKRMPYADADDPDYVELYNYTDLDALLELHGHVRALNPGIQVNIRLASELTDDDFTTHLLLLGGVDWNEITRDLFELVSVPVRQVPRDDDHPDGAFVVGEGPGAAQFTPKLRQDGERRILVEDIAQFICGINPFNRKRTVTVCNGMFGRGTYAAVRALTDVRFRLRNAVYLAERFPNTKIYSILTRVRIVGRGVATPDWTLETTRLHEWPEATG